MKLEIGCGQSLESIGPEWVHNDINPFPHVEYVCKAADIPLPDKSCEYIYMRAVLEHLSYKDAIATLHKIHDLLTDDGYADIIETPNAVSYIDGYLRLMKNGGPTPVRPKTKYVSPIPVINPIVEMPPHYDKLSPYLRWMTIGAFGMQRWDGDDHKSLWTRDIIDFYFGQLFDYEVTENHPFSNEATHYDVRVRRKKDGQ